MGNGKGLRNPTAHQTTSLPRRRDHYDGIRFLQTSRKTGKRRIRQTLEHQKTFRRDGIMNICKCQGEGCTNEKAWGFRRTPHTLKWLCDTCWGHLYGED